MTHIIDVIQVHLQVASLSLGDSISNPCSNRKNNYESPYWWLHWSRFSWCYFL